MHNICYSLNKYFNPKNKVYIVSENYSQIILKNIKKIIALTDIIAHMWLNPVPMPYRNAFAPSAVTDSRRPFHPSRLLAQ